MSATGAVNELMPTLPAALPAGERPMIAIVRSLPGHEPQLAAAISALASAVRSEPGCMEFRPYHDATDPGVFYLYEVYADTDAFQTHLTTPHVAHFLTEVAQHSTTDAHGLIQLVDVPTGSTLASA